MKRVLKVYRAERFSPNSVDKDRAIIDATGLLLSERGFTVTGINENDLDKSSEADIYLTMSRSSKALEILKKKEAEGRLIINSPDGIKACKRSTTDRLMRDNGIHAAPKTGESGYWLKRGDESAQGKDDVIFAASKSDKEYALRHFASRGITDIVVTAHVKGDVVKFYGVACTGFFRTFYADDAKFSKFGDEAINGIPNHYSFQVGDLQRDVVNECQKAFALCDKVGFAVYFDQYADLTAHVDIGIDYTLRSDPACLFSGCGDTLFPQPFDSFFGVAVGSFQGMFAIHHAGAGALS